MKKRIALIAITALIAVSVLSGCGKKDKNTTVTVNEKTVVDETE